MKKNFKNGFILIETLLVTTFVSGVLVYLFIQFTNLSKGYEDSYNYNTVEGLYALRNVKKYIETDIVAYESLNNLNQVKYIDITDCSIVTDRNYCEKLLSLINIKNLYIKNNFDKNIFNNSDSNFIKFVSKINSKGTERYRLLAEFNDFTYATIRFGD